MTNSKIRNYFASIDSMTTSDLSAHYIYLEDLDSAASIAVKKADIVARFPGIRQENIVIVENEIEAWYLAGLQRESCERLGIPHLSSTDGVTKEQFNGLIPTRFRSRTDFMLEVLKLFSIPTAVSKNRSFRYFSQKFQLQPPAASLPGEAEPLL